MPELVGKYKVRDSRVIIDNGHGEISLVTFCASLGIRVGDKVCISVSKTPTMESVLEEGEKDEK